MQRLYARFTSDTVIEELKQSAIDEKPAFQALVSDFIFHMTCLHYDEETLKKIQISIAQWLSDFLRDKNNLERQLLLTLFNNMDEEKLFANFQEFDKFKKFNAKLNQEQSEFLYSLFIRDILYKYYRKNRNQLDDLNRQAYSFNVFYGHLNRALSLNLKPKFMRESFIKRENKTHLICKAVDFEALRDDFISHISEGNIDISTWYQLHKLILNWFECLDETTQNELAERGISNIVLKNNISTPDKLRNYIIRLRKDAKETLVSYFLADKLSAYLNEMDHVDFFAMNAFSKDFFYRYTAQALSIKLNHIDNNFNKKEYLPLITVDTRQYDNSVKSYLHALSQFKTSKDKNAKDLFFSSSQVKIIKKNDEENDYDLKMRLHSHVFPIVFNAIKDKILPPIEEQLAILFHFKKLLNLGIRSNLTEILANTTGIQRRQFELILDFWFPDQKIQNASAHKVIPVINFLTDQIHIIESSKNGKFMVGHYPKNVDDATKILSRLNEDNLILNYRRFKTTCKSLSDRTLQDALGKMLDHLLVIACNERVLDKRAPLFLEAIRLFGHINFIAENIEKSNIELRDKNNLIEQFLSEVEASVNQIKKSYVGFSWFGRLKRDLTNWTRRSDRKVVIQNLPTLNKNDFLMDMGLLKKSIKNSLEAKRLHKLVNLNLENTNEKKQNVLPRSTSSLLSRLLNRISGKKVDVEPVKLEQKLDLFDKTLRIIPKKGGAKIGATYDMLGTDEVQRRFLIKKGGNLGETLSELLAYMVYNESLPNDKSYAAATHLVIKSSEEKLYQYDNPMQFGEHVFVASEYHDAYCAMNACQVAGEKVRPKFIGTRDRLGNPMFDKLIYLNNQCGLGLEYALQAAIRTCDYDFHSENVLLIFDTKKVPENHQAFAMRLIEDFKKLVETKPRKEILVEKMKAIQELDVNVFFQKIDHGYSYKKYQDRSLRLDTSNIFLTGFPIDSNGTQATNHIAEWTAGKKGKDILLTDASCKILMKNTIENEMTILQNATKKFFDALHTASLEYSKDSTQSAVAEFHLLKAFYKHTKDKEYTDYPGDLSQKITDIQNNLTNFMIYNRFRLMESNNSHYLSLLNKIAVKDITTQQIRLQRMLNEQRPQIRRELEDRALDIQLIKQPTRKHLRMGMAGFQR